MLKQKLIMIPVSSSMIESVGWRTGQLYIRFQNGRLYRYDDVPVYVAFAVAVGWPEHSVGMAFHRLVRGRFKFNRIGG